MKDEFVTLVDTLVFYEGNNKHVKIPEDVKEISEFSTLPTDCTKKIGKVIKIISESEWQY